MENAVLDQSPRSTLDVPLSRSGKSSSKYSSFSSSSSSTSSSSSSSSYSPYSSTSSLSHLLPNYNVPAMPMVNTVPNLYQNPTFLVYPPLSLPQPNNQTPLLPLPSYRRASLPSPCNNKTIPNSSTPRRKPRAPMKEPKVQTKNKKMPLEKVLIVSPLKDNVDRFDRYSLAPHPSSLPLPGLSLLRRKPKISNSFNIEGIHNEARLNNSSVDNGASDDLRRILRL